MTATIEAGKLALSFLPNVEVVTLLCAIYGYVFGPIGLISVSLFVLIETFIYGVHTWVIAYIIHWNLICLVFILIRKKITNRFLITGIALIFVSLFGVLTSMIDTLILNYNSETFWHEFSVLYMRGIWFYVTEIVCNLILFPICFPPLAKVLTKFKNKYFGTKKEDKEIETNQKL
ncbi:MAG: hypothetical protein K5765_01950 [Clostridia bacterium]|nr:hypothetical protein [Clostridia bacterium]